MSDMLSFGLDLDMMQGWASLTAGQARGLAVHGLTLSSRSEGSRHDNNALGTLLHKVYVAWHLFNISTLISFVFRRKPIILIKKTIRAALAAAGEGVPDEVSLMVEPSS